MQLFLVPWYEEVGSKVRKKTSSTLKILKSLVDVPCSATINQRKNKHEKRIHRQNLTMKHKEKRLKYVVHLISFQTFYRHLKLS